MLTHKDKNEPLFAVKFSTNVYTMEEYRSVLIEKAKTREEQIKQIAFELSYIQIESDDILKKVSAILNAISVIFEEYFEDRSNDLVKRYRLLLNYVDKLELDLYALFRQEQAMTNANLEQQRCV